MVFAIECIAACVLFTLALEAVSAGRREVFLNDYPPVVTDKLRELHLVVDILMAPFDKFYKLAKVSSVEKSAVWFHFKASVRGMVLGLMVAPVVGLLVTLL